MLGEIRTSVLSFPFKSESALNSQLVMAFSREMNGVDHQADNTTSICRLVFSCSVQFRTLNVRYIQVKALFGYMRHFLMLIFSHAFSKCHC